MKTKIKLTTEQEIKQIAGRLRELIHKDNNAARYMDEQGITQNFAVKCLYDEIEKLTYDIENVTIKLKNFRDESKR